MGEGGAAGRVVSGLRRRARRAALTATRRSSKASGRDPIIVYTLPKTGSSALARSLEHPRVRRPVFQVHLLSDEGFAKARASRAEGGRIRAGKIEAMVEARAAVDDPERHPLVVTMTRHPLRRAVSWYFQSWHRDFPWMGEEPCSAARVDELLDGFHRRLPLALDIADVWFDEEVATVLGHDVFAHPFDRDAGWTRHRLDAGDLAVVRTEDLDRAFADLTRTLLGSPPPLRRVNVAEDKGYAAFHRAFTDRLRLSDDEAARVRATRHARHFYRPDEVEAGLAPFL